MALAEENPALARALAAERVPLRAIPEGRTPLQEALYRERIALMRADVERLAAYVRAAKDWSAAWPALKRAVAGMSLARAHEVLVERAKGVLPFAVDA